MKAVILFIYLFTYCFSVVGQDSIVGIGNRIGWTVREPYPDADETFHTFPDRACDSPALLYNGYRLSSPGVKRPGRVIDQLAPRLKKE
jgi:hypothetical protein